MHTVKCMKATYNRIVASKLVYILHYSVYSNLVAARWLFYYSKMIFLLRHNYIHPLSNLHIPGQGHWWAGAGMHWSRNMPWAQIYCRAHTGSPKGNFESPMSQTACLWTVGGNQSTQKKPPRTRGKHANSTQKSHTDWNLLSVGRPCCDGRVWITPIGRSLTQK